MCRGLRPGEPGEAQGRRLRAEFDERYRAWEWRKAEHDAAEFARYQRESDGVWDDPEAMEATLRERLEEIEWPRETLVDFDLGSDVSTIAVDIDLPGEEEMPDQQWRMPPKQLKLSPRRLSATRQRKLYRDHVHGIAFRVLGAVFARLPGVEEARVSATAGWWILPPAPSATSTSTASRSAGRSG